MSSIIDIAEARKSIFQAHEPKITARTFCYFDVIMLYTSSWQMANIEKYENEFARTSSKRAIALSIL